MGLSTVDLQEEAGDIGIQVADALDERLLLHTESAAS